MEWQQLREHLDGRNEPPTPGLRRRRHRVCPTHPNPSPSIFGSAPRVAQVSIPVAGGGGGAIIKPGFAAARMAGAARVVRPPASPSLAGAAGGRAFFRPPGLAEDAGALCVRSCSGQGIAWSGHSTARA